MDDRIAQVLRMLDAGGQLAPLPPEADLAAAYALQHAVSRARQARGEHRAGCKIGFTNTAIWDDYDIRAPIWGPVWDTTLHPGAAELALGHLPEPRIEPEIVLCLARPPEPGMDAAALAGCVKSVAAGFEVVQSPYPGWRFRAADTVAACALHGALVTGPWAAATADRLAALSGLTARLIGNDALVDTGHSSTVMGGGPLAALAHLVALLAQDPAAPPLAAAEVIATGTLTRALPAAPGQSWRFETDLDWLAPLELRLT